MSLVQWLRCAFRAGGANLMPGLGIKIPQAVLCSQKEGKTMEEREGERNQRKKRQCPVQSIEGIYHVWSFHFLWEEFYRWNENCPDFIGNVKLFFVKHIWSCKWKGISCLSWKFWCFVQCVYFGIFIFLILSHSVIYLDGLDLVPFNISYSREVLVSNRMGNSVWLYFSGLQNHCWWWLQPWN